MSERIWVRVCSSDCMGVRGQFQVSFLTLFETGFVVHHGIYLAGLQLARILLSLRLPSHHGRTSIVNACYRARFTWT